MALNIFSDGVTVKKPGNSPSGSKLLIMFLIMNTMSKDLRKILKS